MVHNDHEHDALQNLTVLYVEDDADVREQLKQFLNRRIGTLITAHDGVSGLEAFHAHRPDVVITDIQMPGMDGLAMSQEIRLANPKVPIIVTTAHEHSHFLKSAIDIGIDRYISKPINTDLLYQSLQQCAKQLRIEDQLALASLAFLNSSEAMMVTEADGTIISVNPAFTEVTGYSQDEIIGKSSSVLGSGRHSQAFFAEMWRQLNETGRWQGEVLDKRKNGEIYAKRLIINTIFHPDGTPNRRVALFGDITQKKAAEELAWKYANFDVLTDLPNRRMFRDRLDLAIRKSHRSGLPMALLFIDLDRFKEVNDALGHDAGDALINQAAQRLRTCVRGSDTVARLGGDEFTVILGELDNPGSVDRVAHNILRKMSEPFVLEMESAFVSASIGITLYPNDATGPEELIKHADQAMYYAKQQGRNRYSYFTPTLQEAAQVRMRIANDLRSAIANNEFHLAYQPIVELATGHIHKAEALIRWQQPLHGAIGPAIFISVAEETGSIIEIGEWVFQQAATQLKQWQVAYHRDFQISINKSPAQFRADESECVSWPDRLRELGLEGHSIVVEITEGLLLDANDTINKRLLSFRDEGMQVAIDDFGTGYSSLAYLKKFDIDYLKIDQSFTRNLAPDSSDLALSEAIVAMAHKLGMKVIAEGVETEQQLSLLQQIGCDYGQGYLFSEPLPAKEFELLLKRQG